MNYHVNEIEMMATVWGIKRCRSYREGKKFILRTDSKAVTWFNKFKESKSKLVRWAILLQEFNFVIEHVPGRHDDLPDAMSHSPVDEIAEESDIENWDRQQ